MVLPSRKRLSGLQSRPNFSTSIRLATGFSCAGQDAPTAGSTRRLLLIETLGFRPANPTKRAASMIGIIAQRIVQGIVGVASATAIFAVDEIPGWSDIGSLAKVSVLACLFALLAGVIFSLLASSRTMQRDHMADIANSRTAMLSEIKDSRDSFGKVIDRVTTSSEKIAERSNDVLNALNTTIRELAAGCAATQATRSLEAAAAQATGRIAHDDATTRHEDDTTRMVDNATRHDDAAIRHGDDVAGREAGK